jgi:HEAT repeat protein
MNAPTRPPSQPGSTAPHAWRRLFLLPLCLVAGSLAVSGLATWLVPGERSTAELLAEVRNRNGRDRWRALYALGRRLTDPRGRPAPARALLDAFEELCAHDPKAAACLGRLAAAHVPAELAAPALTRALATPYSFLKIHCALALADCGGPAALPALEPLTRDPDPGVRTAAAFAIGRRGGDRGIPVLAALLGDAETAVRWNAALGLAALGSDAGSAILAKLLDRRYVTTVSARRHGPPTTRGQRNDVAHVLINGIRAAARLSAAAFRRPILRLANGDADPRVRDAAQRALRLTRGENR